MPTRTVARLATWLLLLSILTVPLAERSTAIYLLAAPGRAPGPGALYALRPPAEAKASTEPGQRDSDRRVPDGQAPTLFGATATLLATCPGFSSRMSLMVPLSWRLIRRRAVPRTWLPVYRGFLPAVQNHSRYL